MKDCLDTTFPPYVNNFELHHIIVCSLIDIQFLHSSDLAGHDGSFESCLPLQRKHLKRLGPPGVELTFKIGSPNLSSVLIVLTA